MNPENTLLTDEQCDNILKTAKLLTVGVAVVDWKIYRSSQYNCFEYARWSRATVSTYDVFGYGAAIDALLAIKSVANLMEFESAHDDLRIILSVNKEPLPECSLADAPNEIHRYLVRKGEYTYDSTSTKT